MTAVLLAAALLLQTQLLHAFAIHGATVSLVLIVVVYESLRGPMPRAALIGLIAGLAEDALSAGTGAGWTIATTLTAAAVNLLGRWFFADAPIAGAVVVAIATLLRRLVFWVVMALEGYPPGYARLHLHQALWEALVNAIVAAVVLSIGRTMRERRLG